MKFRTFAVLCFFVLGLFIIVVFNSDSTDAELNQSRRMDWQKMKGLKWTQDQEDGVNLKFHELKILLEDHHNVGRSKKNAERMALLLNRQGTIIRVDGQLITGEEDIKNFFGARLEQKLTIGPPEIIDVGFVNRVVEGHKVDHYVKLKYNIKMEMKENGEVLKNDDFLVTMILMHRNNCPWDG